MDLAELKILIDGKVYVIGGVQRIELTKSVRRELKKKLKEENSKEKSEELINVLIAQ